MEKCPGFAKGKLQKKHGENRNRMEKKKTELIWD
jgi:hypothetical protein